MDCLAGVVRTYSVTRGHKEMRDAILIVVSVLVVWIVWRIIAPLLFGMSGDLFQLALLALFCYAVYLVYKALNRQRIL